MNYSITSEDKIICPNCRGSLNLKLFNLTYNEIEFTKITCKHCSQQFSFIFCAYCKKKIFMNIYPNSLKYNGLIGSNIKCPYKSCNNIFYFTVCPKCNQSQKQTKNKFIKEGEIISCMNKKCNYQYIEAHHPIKFCTDIVYFEKSKFQTNFPIGILIRRKAEEMIFQKINCEYCFRPIVFTSNKGYKNKYLESQKVECPYEDCEKVFNRLICPSCYKAKIINDGFYEMGSLVKCECKNIYGKIICPVCKRMNICQKKFKFGRIKCGFSDCLKENNMANCIFCRK